MIVARGMPRLKFLTVDLQPSKRYPVYYGNGNHRNRMVWERHIYKNQYETYKEKLKAMGVVYLEDDSSRFGGRPCDQRCGFRKTVLP